VSHCPLAAHEAHIGFSSLHPLTGTPVGLDVHIAGNGCGSVGVFVGPPTIVSGGRDVGNLVGEKEVPSATQGFGAGVTNHVSGIAVGAAEGAHMSGEGVVNCTGGRVRVGAAGIAVLLRVVNCTGGGAGIAVLLPWPCTHRCMVAGLSRRQRYSGMVVTVTAAVSRHTTLRVCHCRSVQGPHSPATHAYFDVAGGGPTDGGSIEPPH
jgi:hypothetical protein